MAVGDRIYIADKETLDSVKSSVDTVSTDVNSVKSSVSGIDTKATNIQTAVSSINSTATSIKSDTDSIKSSMTTNTNSILSAINATSATNREYFTPSEINQEKFRYNSVTLNSTAVSVLHEVSGSGELYGMIYTSSNVFTTSAAITDNLVLELDGVRIYNSSYTHHTSDNYGVLTPNVLLSGSGPSAHLPGTTVGLNNKGVASNPLAAGNLLVYLPKPVRFQSSLRIAGSVSRNNDVNNFGKVYYMYKLD